MRLDKFLANSGIGTRKEVKEIIKKKKISVNGVFVKDGKIHIDENKDVIKYENKVVGYKPFVYIMMNKPAGVISATEDNCHKTVVDLLNDEYRTYDIFPAGRLDIDTEGLLLLTNDGILSHNLLSPKKHVDKKYYVKIFGEIKKEEIAELKKGVLLNDGKTLPAKISGIKYDKNKTSMYISIREGRNRQIRRMIEKFGYKVLMLRREKIGELFLGDLKEGKYRELTREEIEYLYSV